LVIEATRRPFANREQLFLSDVENHTCIIVGTLLVVGTIALSLAKV